MNQPADEQAQASGSQGMSAMMDTRRQELNPISVPISVLLPVEPGLMVTMTCRHMARGVVTRTGTRHLPPRHKLVDQLVTEVPQTPLPSH